MVQVKLLKELAYFVGVMQGDGYFGSYPANDRGNKRIYHILTLSAKDPEMINKIKSIWECVFNRKRRIHKETNGMLRLTVKVKTLLEKFKELDIEFKDPPRPPGWVKNNIELFGPYLAGLIDSDGNVRIKRPKYPQCAIRITSGHPQGELEKVIEKNLHCKASINEVISWNKKWNIWNHGFTLEFLVSSRNLKVIKQYVLSYIQIPRKKLVIEEYLKKCDT